MYQNEIEPMDPQAFVEKTRQELDNILEKHSPVWTTKLTSFIEIQEGLAFRHGFFIGAILTAVVVLTLLLVSRW